jgi:hypothetical protein
MKTKVLIGLLALLLPSFAHAWGNVEKGETTAAKRRIPIKMVDATDGTTPETGLSSFTVKLSKNGAAGDAGGGTVTEVDATDLPGIYYYEASAGEVDTSGIMVLTVAASGAMTYTAAFNVTEAAVGIRRERNK